jgi:hypothetical protein
MPDDHLTPAEHDLAQLAAFMGYGDSFLEDLVHRAELGVGTPVGLLVNGMILMGALAPMSAIAAQVDLQAARIAEKARKEPPPEDRDPAEWEAALIAFETDATTRTKAFEAALASLEKEADEYVDDDGFDLDKAPAELSRSLIQMRTRRYLTLRDVRIVAPGQRGMMRLEAVRIPVQHVAGWWLIPVDDQGNASLTLFDDEGQ